MSGVYDNYVTGGVQKRLEIFENLSRSQQTAKYGSKISFKTTNQLSEINSVSNESEQHPIVDRVRTSLGSITDNSNDDLNKSSVTDVVHEINNNFINLNITMKNETEPNDEEILYEQAIFKKQPKKLNYDKFSMFGEPVKGMKIPMMYRSKSEPNFMDWKAHSNWNQRQNLDVSSTKSLNLVGTEVKIKNNDFEDTNNIQCKEENISLQDEYDELEDLRTKTLGNGFVSRLKARIENKDWHRRNNYEKANNPEGLDMKTEINVSQIRSNNIELKNTKSIAELEKIKINDKLALNSTLSMNNIERTHKKPAVVPRYLYPKQEPEENVETEDYLRIQINNSAYSNEEHIISPETITNQNENSNDIKHTELRKGLVKNVRNLFENSSYELRYYEINGKSKNHNENQLVKSESIDFQQSKNQKPTVLEKYPYPNFEVDHGNKFAIKSDKTSSAVVTNKIQVHSADVLSDASCNSSDFNNSKLDSTNSITIFKKSNETHDIKIEHDNSALSNSPSRLPRFLNL